MSSPASILFLGLAIGTAGILIAFLAGARRNRVGWFWFGMILMASGFVIGWQASSIAGQSMKDRPKSRTEAPIGTRVMVAGEEHIGPGRIVMWQYGLALIDFGDGQPMFWLHRNIIPLDAE